MHITPANPPRHARFGFLVLVFVLATGCMMYDESLLEGNRDVAASGGRSAIARGGAGASSDESSLTNANGGTFSFSSGGSLATTAVNSDNTTAASSANTACEGAEVGGICWYLSRPGESCNETCSEHGDTSPLAGTWVGTTAQGGSRSDCAVILLAMGAPSIPIALERHDGLGLGCTVYDGRSYWHPAPDYGPEFSLIGVRRVCGCNR